MHNRHTPSRLTISIRLVIIGVVLLMLVPGSPVQAWGSLRDWWFDYNTHGNIDVVAWRLLNREVDLGALGFFPNVVDIFNNDFVNATTFGTQLATSTGPDYEPSGGPGPVTPFSWHYGGAPAGTQSLYTSFIGSLFSGTADRAHNAAWLAHFVADQYVPYHTLGVAYTGQSAADLNDPAFNDDPQAFINAAAAATNGNVNWYDPSYWDSSLSTANSTHIQWERGVAHPTLGGVPAGFDGHWDNSQALANRMNNYVQQVQDWSQAAFDLNKVTSVHNAVRGVYTAWRGSITALKIELNVTSSPTNADAFLAVAKVTNFDRQYDAKNVTVKIQLPPGYSLVDPSKETQLVGETGDLPAFTYDKAEWEITGTGTFGTCPIITVWLVSGEYPQGVPDLANALPAPGSQAPANVEAFSGISADVTAPPVVKITAPASGDTVTETKVEINGEISEGNTQSWIEVNGSDKIWISQDFSGGTTFSKEIELKSGDNVITVKAVNQCGKQGKATIHLTGDFQESAIKVVMSWDTNGTDVDLHLTSSNSGDDECYYNNKNPNWGDADSSLDDPTLDIDNTSGYGPETIILPQPKPGQYTVRVVYYSDHDSEQAIPSFVTVKVYENGEFKGTFTNTLPDTDATWESIYTFNIPAPPAVRGAMTAQQPQITEKALTTNLAYQYKPAIDGDRVVWVDERDGNHSQIYGFQLSTNTEKRVSQVELGEQTSGKPRSTLILQDGPAISSSQVVWSDNRYDAVRMYQADLSTGTEITLTQVITEAEARHAIDGGKVVWADRRNGNADIYFFDPATGTEKWITSDPADQLSPDISGDKIVWADKRLGGYTIFLYDLSTNQEMQISRSSTGGLYPPAIDGNYVVWTDGRNGNNDIFLYNLATREEIELTEDAAEQVSPAVSGDKVVWVDYRNGNADIYLYDLTTRTEKAICTNPAVQSEPAISGNRVVWTDERNGNSDIYLADLAETSAQGGLYLPLMLSSVAAAPSGGIQGHLMYQGAAAANLSVDLRGYDGAAWSTVRTTTTDANGGYRFNNIPSISGDQKYYVRYINSETTPNPGPGYLYGWWGPLISSYTSGSEASGGDFDVKDVNLVSPTAGAAVTLPAQFCWEGRGVTEDNYQLIVYNPDLDKSGSTDLQGAATCITVSNLPSGWASGGNYEWWVDVYQGNNPDPDWNYGTSYYYRTATISFSAARQSLLEMNLQISEGSPRH